MEARHPDDASGPVASPATCGLSLVGGVLAGSLGGAVKLAAGPSDLPLWDSAVVLCSMAAQALIVVLLLLVVARASNRLARGGLWRLGLGAGLAGLLIAGGAAFLGEARFGVHWMAALLAPFALVIALATAHRIAGILGGSRAWTGDVLARDLVVPSLALALALHADYARYVLLTPEVRLYVVALAALAGSVVAGSALLASTRRSARAAGAAGLVLLAAVLIWFDATLFQRLYPDFHAAAWITSVFIGARLFAGVSERAFGRRRRLPAAALAAGALVLALAPLANPPTRFHLIERISPAGPLLRSSGIRLGDWLLPPPPIPNAVLAPVPGIDARKDGVRPSLLLVSVDALRTDHVTESLMPNTHRWAQSGRSFDRARTSQPATAPAFWAALSGTYEGHPEFRTPATVGTFSTPVPRDDVMLWRRLNEAGYRTELIGGLKRGYLDRFFDDVVNHWRVPDHKPRPDAETARVLVERLEQLAVGSQPFALWLHLKEPHWPERRPYGNGSPDDGEGYAEVCRVVDRALAGVFEATRTVARDRPLVVVFIADHGEELGEHGGHYHGTTGYDEAMRVPLVIAAPDVTPGRSHDTVSLVDLAPTVLDLLGLAVPEGLDGRTLRPALAGDALPPRPALLEVVDHGTGVLHVRGAVLGRWKVIANYTSGALEVYDLDEDPAETRIRVDRLHEVPAAARALLGLPADD